MIKYSLLCIVLLLSPLPSVADPLWIDVRSTEMHKKNGIAGDFNIPLEKIVKTLNMSDVLTDGKDTEIHLYCNSGYIASLAKGALEQAGYTHVLNAGGVAEARKQRSTELCCLDQSIQK